MALASFSLHGSLLPDAALAELGVRGPRLMLRLGSQPGAAHESTCQLRMTSSRQHRKPPSCSPAMVSASTGRPSNGAMVLEEPFPFVTDDIAMARAAAEEAVALARAAAIAAKQAAALGEAHHLATLGGLSSMSWSSWEMAQGPRMVDAGGNGAARHSHSRESLLPLAWISVETMTGGGGDSQSALAAGLHPIPKAKRIDPLTSVRGAIIAQTDSPPCVQQETGRGPAACPPPRIVVRSKKKGLRSGRLRRAIESSSAQHAAAPMQEPRESAKESALFGTGTAFLDVLPPGSSRDLMDATAGARGLLTFEEEIELSKGVQRLLKLDRCGARLAESLGREPTREEWARELGMSVAELERGLAAGRACKQRMLSCNMGLVISVARKYMNWGLSLEELLTRGCGGLMKGIEKFDHKKGFKFSTYAHWWIRQAIGRTVTEQSRTVRLPLHMFELMSRISKAREMLQRELQRTPLDEEVAELVGMSVPRLHRVMRSARSPISMDKPLSTDSEQTLGAFVASPVDETHELNIERKLLNKDLQNALHTLLPREREVMKLRYGLEDGRARTLEEIGAVFRVTRERIRQIEHRALRKLRQPCRSTVLREYME